MKLTREQLRQLIQEVASPELRGGYNYHAFAEFWAEYYDVPYEVTHSAIKKNDYSEISKLIVRKGTVKPILDNYIEFFTGVEGVGYESLLFVTKQTFPILASSLVLFEQNKMAKEVYILLLSEIVSILFESVESGSFHLLPKPARG